MLPNRLKYQSYLLIICATISLVFTNCNEEAGSVIYPDYTGQIDSVIDIEGNVYKTIGIGSQIWMAENLRTLKLNNGTVIPQVKVDSDWHYNKTPAYCFYNNDSINFYKIYGPLYNFYAVNTDSLCPTGWHVPKDSEWAELINFLGGVKKAGGKLKDYYTSYWSEPNLCFVNNYGFAALPGGMRQSGGKFIGITTRGYWWTSTSIDDLYAYAFIMFHDNIEILKIYGLKKEGYSVRCIKD